MFGACLVQSERNRLTSQTQFSARALAAACHHKYHTLSGDSYSVAENLRDYLRKVAEALPCEFLSHGVVAYQLRTEGRDAVTYARDADGRRSVEESRILAFGAG